MADIRLRTWTPVLTAVVTLGLIAGVAARQSRTFEQWWGQRYAPGAGPRAALVEARTRDVAVHALGMLRHWNSVAVDASGLDHTPQGQGEPHEFGAQLGPGRSSRAMAIVHIAIFEAVNAIDRRYESYLGIPEVGSWLSMDAAIALAAHERSWLCFRRSDGSATGYSP